MSQTNVRRKSEASDDAENDAPMDARESVAWLRQVDGELFRTAPNRKGREGWVAVVRTPGAVPKRGRMIIALGESLEEAANAAAHQWRQLFRDAPVH